jgi:hypothetical protein
MKASMVVAAFAAIAGSTGLASAQVVFQNSNDNGYFTPFSTSTPAGTRFGDSGWIGSGADAPVALNTLRLGLVVAGGTGAGTTDLTFTFNDGDPSGLVFGPGTTTYSTTITNVTLPDASAGAAFFDVTIPLFGTLTTGGFNNIGWSVGVQNFNYSGTFGFQCASTLTQSVGFYTNNASQYNPGAGSWSLFSFGGGTFGVANFVAQLTVPSPAGGAVLAMAGVLATRRRRAQA